MRATRDEDKREAWQTTLPLAGKTWVDVQKEGKFKRFNELVNFFEPFEAQVDSLLQNYCNIAMGDVFSEATRIAGDITAKCGGLENGLDYKGEYERSDATYEEIWEHSQITIFDNSRRGITKKLGGLKDSAVAILKRVGAEAAKFGYDLTTDEAWKETKTNIINGCGRIDTTLNESKVMHNASRDLRTAVNKRQVNVDRVVSLTTQLDEDGTPLLVIHPSIKAKAHDFLRV